MQIGQRTYNAIKMGQKNLGIKRIGIKSGPVVSTNTISAHTPNGNIMNYSNSSDVARTPMKGVEIKTSKSKSIQIEKPRKRSESNSDFE